MATWEQQPIKFEHSPTESFASVPGDSYPSLFESQDNTLDPAEMMTPPADATPAAAPDSASPAPDGKKPTKKRKSWGQVLPEPKTNLPPRKRAKTEDEKEQRRVERVLRNRRAAQSSRERKRQEVEALEEKNKLLEAELHQARQANVMLADKLQRFMRESGSTSSLDSLRSADLVTLSSELFSSHDTFHAPLDASKPSFVDELIKSTSPNPTVNPASLSPVPEADETEARDVSVGNPAPADTSSDLTQRPAAMLCDLQCQSEEMTQSWVATQTPQSQMWALALHMQVLMTASATFLTICQRPLTQIALSMKAGFSLPPTQAIMSTIIWLVTRPSRSRSTSASSSTRKPATLPPPMRTRRTTPRTRSSTTATSTLRLKYLRKILTCSPNLARPLMDATMEALRLASENIETLVGDKVVGSAMTRDVHRPAQARLAGHPLPSKEVLLTLLWALRVEERKLVRQGKLPPTPAESSISHSPSDITYVLKVDPSLKKRKVATEAGDAEKRLRFH